MTSIRFEGHRYELASGESVLECLERNGRETASRCRTGVCQSCLLKCRSGDIPTKSQHGLKASWLQAGYFLPCVCRPDASAAGTLDLVRPDDVGLDVTSRIVARRTLVDGIVEVHVAKPEGFEFLPGQFVHLIREEDELSRPYSIANQPDEDCLRFHVRIVPTGAMSPWLASAPLDSPLRLRGPSGDCCYQSGTSQEELLLIATGTGLAPIFGVLEAALHAGHQGPIQLYHGAARRGDLYLKEELQRLEESHSNLSIHPCVLPDGGRGEMSLTQMLSDAALSGRTSLKGVRVYLAGNPDTVSRLKKQAYLAGADLSSIHADPFLGSGSAVTTPVSATAR